MKRVFGIKNKARQRLSLPSPNKQLVCNTLIVLFPANKQSHGCLFQYLLVLIEIHFQNLKSTSE
jgi:hypothetical protein